MRSSFRSARANWFAARPDGPRPFWRSPALATVLLSIVAHGLSALPGIDLYARKIASLGTGTPEREEIA